MTQSEAQPNTLPTALPSYDSVDLGSALVHFYRYLANQLVSTDSNGSIES